MYTVIILENDEASIGTNARQLVVLFFSLVINENDFWTRVSDSRMQHYDSNNSRKSLIIVE